MQLSYAPRRVPRLQHPQTPGLTPALAEGKGSSVLRAGEEQGARFGLFFPKIPLGTHTLTYHHTLPPPRSAAATRLPKPQVPPSIPRGRGGTPGRGAEPSPRGGSSGGAAGRATPSRGRRSPYLPGAGAGARCRCRRSGRAAARSASPPASTAPTGGPGPRLRPAPRSERRGTGTGTGTRHGTGTDTASGTRDGNRHREWEPALGPGMGTRNRIGNWTASRHRELSLGMGTGTGNRRSPLLGTVVTTGSGDWHHPVVGNGSGASWRWSRTWGPVW